MRIFDRLQDESLGRRRRSCFARAIAGKTGRYGRSAYIPAAGFDQCPDDVPDHMFEEATPANRINQRVPGARQLGAKDAANSGLLVIIPVIRSGKSREIVLAFEDPRGLDHGSFVERIWVMMHIPPLERRTHRRAEQSVLVGLGNRVEAGMKTGFGLDGIENPNRGRQQAVDGALQISHRDGIRNRESRDLRERVDAGIGAAGSGDMNRLSFHAADDLFEHALDRRETRLHLPSVEFGAVVSQGNADTA